jgi:hypothetical protein
MRPRIVLSSLSIGIVGLSVLGLSGARSGPLECPGSIFAPPVDSSAAPGASAAALQGDALVLVDEEGHTARYRHDGGKAGLLRHADARPGTGIVYVNDVRGPDTLVVVGNEATERLRTAGEAFHPTLGPGGVLSWSEGLRRLLVRSSAGEAVKPIAAPRGTRAVFSPVFVGRSLVAVVEESVRGVPHDTGLDNLYRVDPETGRWRRLTDFEAGSDRWSAIRTPVVGRDDEVWFVRVSGRASATARPTFGLWRLDGEGARRVGRLPGEAYLAGALDGRLLWNVYLPGSSSWGLVLGGPEGRLLGCGAVMTDPRSTPDPDLAAAGTVSGGPGEPAEVPAAQDGTVGIVVGDFDSREEAEAVAGRIGASSRVIGHGRSPAAVGPERFAAAISLEAGADAVEELDEFRARFPEYAERSWIGVLGAPGGEGG